MAFSDSARIRYFGKTMGKFHSKCTVNEFKEVVFMTPN